MKGVIASRLKQKRFASPEQEIFLGLIMAAARVIEPWEQFLKTNGDLTNNQYNVLRILRGSHPGRITCSDISERMVARDPDITRLVDRLETRDLVERARSTRDRRVVEVGITSKGLALVHSLDVHAQRMPKALLGHLGLKRSKQLRDLLEVVLSELGTFP